MVISPSYNGLSGYTQLQDFSTLFKRVSELEQVISVLISRIGDDPNAYTDLNREEENIEGDRDVQEDELEEENEREVTSDGGGTFGAFDQDHTGQTGRDQGHVGFAFDEPQGGSSSASYRLPNSNPQEPPYSGLSRSAEQLDFPGQDRALDELRSADNIPGPSHRDSRTELSGLERHTQTTGEDDERGAAYRFEVSSSGPSIDHLRVASRNSSSIWLYCVISRDRRMGSSGVKLGRRMNQSLSLQSVRPAPSPVTQSSSNLSYDVLTDFISHNYYFLSVYVHSGSEPNGLHRPRSQEPPRSIS